MLSALTLPEVQRRRAHINHALTPEYRFGLQLQFEHILCCELRCSLLCKQSMHPTMP